MRFCAKNEMARVCTAMDLLYSENWSALLLWQGRCDQLFLQGAQ